MGQDFLKIQLVQKVEDKTSWTYGIYAIVLGGNILKKSHSITFFWLLPAIMCF